MKNIKMYIAIVLLIYSSFSIYSMFCSFTDDIAKAKEISKVSDYVYDGNDENIILANRQAGKCVALTFDDGPHPKYTEEILEILKKYDAKATFFVIGKNAELYPELIKKEYSLGHEIGNHTYSHPNLRNITAAQFTEEIEKAQTAIYNITGERPKLFRPPGGYLNNVLVNELVEHDYSSVLWSWRQDTKDWEKPSSDSIVKSVLNNLQDGDIILFHDYIRNKSPTPKALETILQKLKEKGYSFVGVSELVERKAG